MIRRRDQPQLEAPPTPPSPLLMLLAFGGLSAGLAAGYGVLFTVVDDYRDEYGISESAIGVVIGIGFLSAFVAQIFIAPLADRGHARKVVLAGVAVNVVGLVMMGLGESLAPILAGRVVSGLGIGAAVPAIRRIVILADPEHVGQNIGRLLAADVFGFALGPAVSALLVGPFGIPVPFFVVAASTVIALPFVARVRVIETEDPQHRGLAIDLMADRAFAGAVVLGSVVFVMIGGFDALWSVVHADLGTTEWIANLGITLFAIPLVFLGPPGGRLAQTFGPFKLGAIGLVLGAAFMFGYGLLPTGGLIFAIAMFHALSDGLTVSSTGVAVAMVVDEERQAGAQGVLGAAQAVAGGVTAVVIGVVYDAFGRFAAYAVCSVTMLVLVGLGLWLARDAIDLRRPIAQSSAISN